MAVIVEEEEVLYPEEVQETMRESLYDEARTWFDWIQIFTVDDIAEFMGIHEEVAERLCTAGEWHQVIVNTGDSGIYEYIPPPTGPTHHPHQTPEWRLMSIGCYELACATGMPVRIRTEREMRKVMSTSGGAGIHKRREQAYQRQQEAVRQRKAAAERRSKEGVEDKKWRKHKRNSIAV